MFNFELVFTILIAWLVFKERLVVSVVAKDEPHLAGRSLSWGASLDKIMAICF